MNYPLIHFRPTEPDETNLAMIVEYLVKNRPDQKANISAALRYALFIAAQRIERETQPEPQD